MRYDKKQFTGMTDRNCDEIYFGDSVELFGMKGKIVFECGAYGIGFDKDIDYSLIQMKMNSFDMCCGNRYIGCFNDNFLSLWELYWNFNCEEECIDVLEILDSEV